MRPKTVVLVLALAVGILGCLVALKTFFGGAQALVPTPRPETNPVPAVAASNPGESAITNIVATTPKQDQEARIDADLEALRETLTGEPGRPESLVTIADRLLSPDVEVRKAAVVTAMHLGDTNILPYLTGVLSNIEDPREKVAIMDAIDYLKLLMNGEREQTNAENMTNSEPTGISALGTNAGTGRAVQR